MEKSNHKYREIIERYCNIIDANAALIMTDFNGRVVYECLSRANCEKLYGGCKNRKYGKISNQGAAEAVPVDVPAQISNGRTMVPARVIVEAFGADADRNGNGRAVLITE